ncbi:P-type conjugative transfer protein TrbG [uncultured Sphingomonas sp.]|uniref:P-type conjugative transfer protein TrbG n=1 Tax=uncultured Sphingomonas sp. TaxID=158754 RepID=UPI0035CB083C
MTFARSRRSAVAVLLLSGFTVGASAAAGTLVTGPKVGLADPLPPANASPSPAPSGAAATAGPSSAPLIEWDSIRPTAAPTDIATPLARVAAANAAARVQPSRFGYLNAIQQYAFADGDLFQVYASPGKVTDITLQDGEVLVGAGPVAAGDTTRWIIGDTESGLGTTRRVHILVKPTRPDLVTNMVINTDRRTYHLELRANPSAWMASVSWRYPADELIALRRNAEQARAAVPIAAGIDLDALNFAYTIKGDVRWKPLRAFDDGTHVYIEFAPSIAQGEMPPLFVVGANGKTAELVNYRVQGHRLIVDRLFAVAELRLGAKHQQKVRITRTSGTRS